MTIEEAIQHCREQAAALWAGGTPGCAECAAEHKQLAEWLEELQEKRCKVIVQANRIKEMRAEIQEPARWLHRKRNGYAVLVCSACEREKEGYTRTAYCPHCGRPMTGEGEQE